MADPPNVKPENAERLTSEELRTVRGAGLFELYLGRGWMRHLIIYGFPGITAMLIASGIFCSFIAVPDTLMLYAQPAWVPGEKTGARVGVMDEKGEFVPITRMRVTLLDKAFDRDRILFDGKSHGTVASLTIDVPSWPAGEYEMVVRATTMKNTREGILTVRLDPGYDGEKPVITHEMRAWRERFDDEDFMKPGSPLDVELFAESGMIASSLPNILYVRCTDRRGVPVRATVSLALAQGFISGELPDSVETDALGLAALIVYPTYNSLVLDVSAQEHGHGPGFTTAGEGLGAGEGIDAGPDDLSHDAPPASEGRVIVPIGPQGIRLRALVPAPFVGEPISLRVYSVGKDMNMFTDLYRESRWIAAFDAQVDGQSFEVAAPAALGPGLHVVQAYSSPVPAIFQKLPGLTPELLSASMSAAHVWVRDRAESDQDTVLTLAGILATRGVDVDYVSQLTPQRIEQEGVNLGLATAFLLSRLDGALFPPLVASSSRDHDTSSAATLRNSIRTTVIVALVIVCAVVVLALGILTYFTWRAGRGGASSEVACETPMSSADARWLRHQVFQMSMLIAVVVGMFGLLAILVAYLRWQMS